METKYDIFISYRRDGGYDTAKHLYDLLTRDGYSVSFDIDTLRNGDFDIELLKRIDECTDFVLVLDKNAFKKTLDPKFRKEHDWMRNELAYALQKEKNIIPIMLTGFSEFPNNLPSDIAKVAKKNGPKYDQYYFDDFYRRLKEMFLESELVMPKDNGLHKQLSEFSKKEDISLHDISMVLNIIRSKGKYLIEIVEDSWSKRNIVSNIIFCLYLLPLILLLFIFIEILNHRNKDLTELSLGFYTITFLYGIYQSFLNRRDGIYSIVISPIIAVSTIYFISERYSPHLWDSIFLLFLFSIPLLFALLLRKKGKSTWQQMKGGVFGLLKWKRHFLYYLWCVAWVFIVIYKTQIVQRGY